MVVWLCLGTAIVLYDVAFVLLRPASLPGGSLGALFRVPYATYVMVDRGYGDVGQPFVWAQAIMSLLESLVTFAALAASARRLGPQAMLLAFCSSTLTCAKTVLIMLVEIVSRGGNVGHNDLGTLIGLYLVPNGVWIVVPLAVAIVTGRTLLRRSAGARPESPASPLPALAPLAAEGRAS